MNVVESTGSTLEDAVGEPLDRRIGSLPDVREFLSLAIAITAAVGEMHARGLIHKDLKPANILVDPGGRVSLTGFAIASRSAREHQTAQPPEALAGTLPYMSPEQTGRMNRSIDSRSDLYSLGVTLYELLTGRLPFTGADPLDWIHCHVARLPIAPLDLRPQLPEVIGRILLKLLAKSADERYQTAAGLEADWRRCLQQWNLTLRIDPFSLGEQDAPDHLTIPEKLYGRERELEALRLARDQAATVGAPMLMLLAGYAGVGKSAIVHEIQKDLAGGSWFTAGKCDQYQRDIPYMTLMNAFGGLARQLLCLPEAETASWRERLGEALQSNGRIILDLVPELEPIMGPQPPLPEVPPQDRMNRFLRVMRRFLAVFAKAQRPLILFLDDLQWLDGATLDLLEHLLTEPEVRHLLVIGAYRDNEVDSVHPLAIKLTRLREQGVDVRVMALAALCREDVARLVGAALHCPRQDIAELADLVYSKTHGNPFFILQFLTNLEQEGLLQWRGARAGWWLDMARIEAKGFTDNVAHLLVGRLSRLSPGSRAALQRLACFGGGGAPIALLMSILEIPEQSIYEALDEAVAAGHLMLIGGEYHFVHDRVQEAAYSLIPEPDRAPLHLRIGWALYDQMRDGQINEHVFEIVHQLNHARELITAPHERRTLAELNLIAGTRARRSSAYTSALQFLTAGSALLTEDRWSTVHDLAFNLEFLRAECEFLTGSSSQAEVRLAALAAQAGNASQGAAVACLRQTLYAVLGRNDRAVGVCLEFLRQHGVMWPAAPGEEHLQPEYARLWEQLEGRRVEDLAEMPEIVVPQQRAILDVLASSLAMALMSNGNLFRLIVCRMANLSLEYGHCDASTLAYTYINFIVGEQRGDYALGLRFGQLALTLLEKGFRSYKARVEVAYGSTILPWTQPGRTGVPWVRRSVQSAQEAGDLTFACYNWYILISLLLRSGESLEEVQQEAERALQFARKLRFSYMVDLMEVEVAFLRAMRGLTAELSCFTHEGFDESSYQKRLVEDPSLRSAAYFYWLHKLQANWHAGEYPAASLAASRAHECRWETLLPHDKDELDFYSALTAGALSSRDLPGDLPAMAARCESLAAMAANSPENFGSHASLVAAELSRLQGRGSEAETLYDEAVRRARQAALIHDEAIALEVAARHYLARGLTTVAHTLLRSACSCYQQWGAIAKIRRLERDFPALRAQSSAVGVHDTIGLSFLELDAASVIQAAQTLSSEIVPENLIRRLLTLSLKQAGAERGLLILIRDGTPRLEAEAATDHSRTRADSVLVEVKRAELNADLLPTSILQWVLRTQRCVSLEDAMMSREFAGDDYLRQRRPRSVLCQPITRQGRLIGVLYLENPLVAGLFTPSRTAVLEVLAAQAAISLENAYLYRDVRERESLIRHLLDSNMVGIFFWTVTGAIVDANDAFLRLVGYTRENLVSGALSWHALIPPEYRERASIALEQIRSGGVAAHREWELLRSDGARVAAMIGGTLLEGTDEHGVSFVLDLTERQRAEHEREARRVAEAANSAKSDFLATMSHELRTPLNAILGFAQILQKDPTLSERQRKRSDFIRDSGEHLLKLINDLLDLAKIEAGKLSLNIADAAIDQLLAAVHASIWVKTREKGLELRWHRAPDLPARVRTDERRLRQILLNLLANAVRFTDRGWVSLSVATSGGRHVRFEVSDSGVGMSPDQLRKLFQRFEQVGDVEHSAGGTGLGLAISRNLVRLMGGELQVTSSPGAGSTFWFELELNKTGERCADSGPKPVIAGYAGPRRSVLVVDDVLESRAVLVELLEPLGFQVAQAENGAAALNMARAARPDLIVTDLAMPEVGGHELTRRLRENADLASVPIIVISASNSARSGRERQTLAQDAFFTKPIDTEALLVSIASLLGIQWEYSA